MTRAPVQVRPRPALASVVVPVLNAAEHLPAQLDAIAGQDYSSRFEVVIADNGSSDGSIAIAERALSSFQAARLVHAGGRRSAGRARNVGAAHASGEFLAFCDADDVVDRDWLRELVFAAQGADLVAGAVDVELLSTAVMRSWHPAPPREQALGGYRFLNYASGTNTGVWADVFAQVGSYDEGLASGEDIELSWRAQLASFRLAAAPLAVVHERLRPGVRALARQHYRYGHTGPTLFKRYASAGMPRSPTLARLRTCAWAALSLPLSPLSPGVRGRCAREAAYLAGRLDACARNRVVYI